MPTEVHTICFHTRDAVERDDSRLVFEMPQHRVRNPAAKVALGSVEFPMVQWTVEEEWRRLYVNEGVRVLPGANVLRLAVRYPSLPDPKVPTTVGVPPNLNAIVSVTRREGFVDFECEVPHCLWSGDGKASLVRKMCKWGGRVRLVACDGGDVSLTTAEQDGDLQRVSETAFRLREGLLASVVGRSPRGSSSQDGGRVHAFLAVDVVPSPQHLCELLTLSARGATFLEEAHDATSAEGEQGVVFLQGQQEVVFRYDAKADCVKTSLLFPPGTLVRVLPSPLASRMGLTSTPVIVPDRNVGPTPLPAGPTCFWDYVELPTGFYGPCHRPMSTGQPLRFGTEVEACINRLYFPLPSSGDGRLQASPSTPHTIVFVDPWARTNMCPIPCGRYTPSKLCSYLEAEMTRICGKDATFSIAHVDERFVFSCERRRSSDGRVEPAAFSLLFNHPLCTEASRFGFPSQPCVGACTYISPDRVHVPLTDDGLFGESGPRFFSNLIRVSEIGAQKRFRLHATSAPTLTALVCDEEKDNVLCLRTHVNRLPYSHGYQSGDLIRIVACEDSSTFLEPTTASRTEWKEAEYPSAAEVAHDTTCVVIANESGDPTLLFVRAPSRAADVGTCVNVLSAGGPDPWNLCFSESKPKGVDAYMLGFPARSILWGVDGSIDTGAGLLPPFDAPYVHSLDHPDYVLITLNESSGAGLEHSYNGESKHVFCKLSLYPLFREERMLPRDSSLSRSTFSRFEIAFWNPDMRRPYKFHGAEFSFSLNFLSGVPGD